MRNPVLHYSDDDWNRDEIAGLRLIEACQLYALARDRIFKETGLEPENFLAGMGQLLGVRYG